MVTQAAHSIHTDSPLPLYRLDVATYHRLVEAGALDGVDVELREGGRAGPRGGGVRRRRREGLRTLRHVQGGRSGASPVDGVADMDVGALFDGFDG